MHNEVMKHLPTGATVASKLIRTLLFVAVQLAAGAGLVWLYLQIKRFTWIPIIGAYLNQLVILLAVMYLLMWLSVYWSYQDFRFVSDLHNACQKFREGRFQEAVDFATMAHERKKRQGLPHVVRARAYAALGSVLLAERDFDLARGLGLEPDHFVI